MALPTISAADARRMMDEGAILVDIREPDEHAREKVPGARNLPLSRLDEADLAVQQGKPVIFHCRSGARTLGNGQRLAARVGEGCEAFVVEGGLDAWKKAGLPVVADRQQPLELQRQVQIGADEQRDRQEPGRHQDAEQGPEERHAAGADLDLSLIHI